MRLLPLISLCANMALLARLAHAQELSARVEGDAIVLSEGGREARVQRNKIASVELMRVPLKADGTEPAIWASVGDADGSFGLLLRFGEPPKLIHSVQLARANPHISSTHVSIWLLDVDGDGWNDIIEYPTTWSDVGSQSGGPSVKRWDGKANRFQPGGRALDKLAPRVMPGSDRRINRFHPVATRTAHAERRAMMSMGGKVLPSPPRPQTVGIGGGGLPFVGAQLVETIIGRKPGKAALGGDLFVMHTRLFPKLEVVRTIRLGPIQFGPNVCGGRKESLSREGDQIVAVWPQSPSTMVEQKVPWDGTSIKDPDKLPIEVASCPAP